MKNRFIKCAVLALSALFILSGCAQKETGVSLSKFSALDVVDFNGDVLAQNKNYVLGFDKQNNGIYIENKNSGEVFSANTKITEKMDEEVFVQPQIRSDIWVDYVDADGRSVMTAYSFLGCVSDGSITYEKTDRGCIVYYCFNEEEFSIPVEYTLKDDGIYVSFDPTKITENERKVLRVSINPFMCSVANDTKDSYLFVPSGSGAISYPITASEIGNVYSQYVYGEDPTIEKWAQATAEQNVLLPVFGVKRSNVAVCGIIEEGAENARIDATVGSSQYGFSSVYCTFDVRAYSPVQVYMYGYKKKTVVYSDGVINRKCGVGFYPLFAENADYSGMAKLYREKSGIKKVKDYNQTTLNLVIYGGSVTKKSFFGIPYDSVYAATTINQAKNMIEELSDITGESLSVLLRGFGSTGLNVGEIAGGYKINKNLGNVSQLAALNKKCNDLGVNLYFDFDVVKQSDNSWFSFKDSAKSPNSQTVYQYDYDVALRKRIDDTRYSLLSRSVLKDISGKLLNKTKNWNLQGISLQTLSQICYSDNATNKYLVCGNMTSDVANIIKAIKKNGKKFAGVNANYYVAKNSDLIFESPNNSNKNDIFSEDVPFYQLVFKGYVPITSEVVNLASSDNLALLKAIESGSGITYGLYKQYDSAITDAKDSAFNTGTYDDIKGNIKNTYDELKDYYSAIKDAKITKHMIEDNSLRVTEFDNGVSVYVNYSKADIITEIGTVKANSWLFNK